MVNLAHFFIGVSLLAEGFVALAFRLLLMIDTTIERTKAIGFFADA